MFDGDPPPDIYICQHNLNIQNDLYTSFNSWGFGVLGIPKIPYEKNGQISRWPQIFFKSEFLNSERWGTSEFSLNVEYVSQN